MPSKIPAKKAARAKKSAVRKAPAKPRTQTTAATKTSTKTSMKTSAKLPTKTSKAHAAKIPALHGAVMAVAPRRAVFIDVENTSSESELGRVLDELRIDLTSGTTDVTAIGNWRVVGQQLGRSLAQRGAHLVHSAPATRVPDWSDLWIAVQAGIWLGRSRPGDAIDIVSHDRAFDAVGDAAARLGVTFNRITYRSAGPSTVASERASASEATGERRPRRRRRRGGSGRGPTSHATPAARSTHVAASAASVAASGNEERQAASQDELQHVIARLAAADPAHTVTLDALTVALKAAGHQRPPGSPRLVTRLRRMKDVEVLPNGRLRMVVPGEATAVSAAAEPFAEPATSNELDELDGQELDGDEPSAAGENGTASETGVKRRSRRRGGRRRGGRGRKGATGTPAPPAE